MDVETSSAAPAPQGNPEGDRKLVQIVYGLMLPVFMVVPPIIGAIIAHVMVRDTQGMARSHFIYQIRTFWLGLAIVVVGFATQFLMIGELIMLLAIPWVIVRCVRGFGLANERKAHPNPHTYLW